MTSVYKSGKVLFNEKIVVGKPAAVGALTIEDLLISFAYE